VPRDEVAQRELRIAAEEIRLWRLLENRRLREADVRATVDECDLRIALRDLPVQLHRVGKRRGLHRHPDVLRRLLADDVDDLLRRAEPVVQVDDVDLVAGGLKAGRKVGQPEVEEPVLPSEGVDERDACHL